MNDMTGFLADEDVPRARYAFFIKHLSRLVDEREPWRVAYPLAEVLLLLTCATIASCDDFGEIVTYGKHHLDFLRKFAPFHHGGPKVAFLLALKGNQPVLEKETGSYFDTAPTHELVTKTTVEKGQGRTAWCAPTNPKEASKHAENQ